MSKPLEIVTTTRFSKDVKRAKKRNKPLGKLSAVVKLLQTGQELPIKLRDHQLTGNWVTCRECHIEPDWLLIYRIDSTCLILVRTGSHSDLF